MATRDNHPQYYSSNGLARAKSPSPPDSHAGYYSSSHSASTTHSGQYPSPPRAPATSTTTGRYGGYDGYSTSWQGEGHGASQRTPAAGYSSSMEPYNSYYPSPDPRYANTTAYPAAYPQSGTADSRKLPPLPGLNLPPHGGRVDDRYYSGSSTSSSTNVRSPAAYPGTYGYDSYAGSQPEYTLPPPPPGSSGMPLHTTSALPSRRGSHMSTTPPPTSPTGPEDSPTIKKKRKRADAAQLKILNDVYARTAFPSTEERQQLAKTLDMSPRSVQIWFQNKRQQTRQTRTSSNHQAYAAASAEAQAEEAGYARAQDIQRSRPRAQEPASHWPKPGY